MTGQDVQGAFIGSMLGLALGDALGAPLEGGLLERGLWRLIGTTSDGCMRYTDDTQMSLDIADSLIACRRLDQDDIATRFGRSYRWSRGYGPGAARVLKLIQRGVDWRAASTSVYSEGSFGNGGAMRAPVVGLFYAGSLNAVVQMARASAVVTHAHPIAQDGAGIVALATALATTTAAPGEILRAALVEAQTPELRERLALAISWSTREVPSSEVQKSLGNSMSACESCVTAIHIAMRFLDRGFLEMLEFVAACRGDVDTIGAMAGAIWGARNGAASLPEPQIALLERAPYIRETAIKLHGASTGTA